MRTTQLLSSLLLTVLLASASLGQTVESVVGTRFGEVIDGVSVDEFQLFVLGQEDFMEVEDAAEGLGPVFNGRGCSECHAIPRVGGSGTIIEQRAGILRADGSFVELEGGSLFQLFSLPPHTVQARIPAKANSTAGRKSLALFGLGLVEAVPDSTFLAMADPSDRDGDGISGRARRVFDPATRRSRVGKFGWKAQQATLMAFGAEAYRDEMGITNDLFPEEACPYGVDCEEVALADLLADPEDSPEPATGLRGIDLFETFMLFLGPPPRAAQITPKARRGENVFAEIGCGSCHTPALESGSHPSPALSFKRFSPYGDFLLHDIDTGDGIGQAAAAPNEVRTPPLWGLRVRGPLMHDGRASNFKHAIELHGGEAAASREAFRFLTPTERQELLAFLRSL
ncbi:MAG: di-heme oxidoredictase family protein [Acidobacteriota bacterium]|nr:di-heme oxidoredictase family protein [Acidobacteriota bacterium]